MPHDNGTRATPGIARRWTAGRRPAASRSLDPRPPRARIALGGLALLLIVLGSLVIVAVAARGPGALSPPSRARFFPAWLAGPLGGTWPFTSTATTLVRIFNYAVIGMYLFYLLAVAYAPRLRRRWTLAAILAAHVIFLLAPPLPLTDVFNYLNYGRMEIVHGLNPYVTIPVLEPHGDPAYAVSNWHHLLSPYGPLFTIFTFALVPLGVATSFWVFKATLMLASLAMLWLIWRCAEMLHRDPLRAVVLVGLNPAVLVWGLGGDHNDFLMVLFVMVCVYCLLSSRRRPVPTDAGRSPRPAHGRALIRRLAPAGGLPGGTLSFAVSAAPVARLPAARAGPATPPRTAAAGATRAKALHVCAGAALVAACAIKLPAAILAPIFLAAAPRRFYLLAGMACGLLAVGLASYSAFGPHLPDLGVQSDLVSTSGLPNLLGSWLGLGGETVGLRTVLTVILLVTVALATVCAARRLGDWMVPAAVPVLVLVLTLSWVVPWYVLWLLPLAALARRGPLRAVTLLVGVYLVFVFTSVVSLSPTKTVLQQIHSRATQYLVH
ncbi:MAG: hypothetical protein ACR2KV_18095 [Solirubrobacteraceae bacterium]